MHKKIKNIHQSIGTHKALKGFKNLLLRRIKWNETNEEDSGGVVANGTQSEPVNPKSNKTHLI